MVCNSLYPELEAPLHLLFLDICIEEVLYPFRICCNKPVMLSLNLIAYNLGIGSCKPVLGCRLHYFLYARNPLAAEYRADRKLSLLKYLETEGV